jgi:hypothetical protein
VFKIKKVVLNLLKCFEFQSQTIKKYKYYSQWIVLLQERMETLIIDFVVARFYYIKSTLKFKAKAIC